MVVQHGLLPISPKAAAAPLTEEVALQQEMLIDAGLLTLLALNYMHLNWKFASDDLPPVTLSAAQERTCSTIMEGTRYLFHDLPANAVQLDSAAEELEQKVASAREDLDDERVVPTWPKQEKVGI